MHFEVYMIVLQVGRDLIGLAAPLGFKVFDSLRGKSNVGLVSIDVYDLLIYSEKSRRPLDLVLVVFSGRGFEIHICVCFGRNPKDAWRKDM